MTLAELRSLVWYFVDDQQGISTGSGGYFTTTQVDVFLNNALQETQKQLLQAGELYYLKTVETVTVAGQQDYVLPTDFLKLHRLEYVLSGTTPTTEDVQMLQWVSLNQSDIISTRQGTPISYALKQDRFSLYPIPDTANKTLRLYYSYRIANLVNTTDVPDIPKEFHEYIAILAAESCFVKDDRSSAQLVEKKAAYLTQFKQISEDRRQDGPRTVLVTTDDGFGALF